MTDHSDLYQWAEYYDIAFDFRDVVKECNFLMEAAGRRLGRAPESFLELAAGPAYHSMEFARRGLRATALDLSQHMVDYGLAKARGRGLEIDYICSDMTDFRLEQTFDGVTLLMDSAVYMLDNDTVLRNLACVAEHLAERGVYVLELSHPRDVFGVGKSAQTEWTMERDGKRVSMDWGDKDDPFDPTTQITTVTVEMSYSDGESSGSVIDRAPQRCFTPNEVRALVAASGRFEIVEEYGSLDLTIPFSNDKPAWRMAPVLQKTA